MAWIREFRGGRVPARAICLCVLAATLVSLWLRPLTMGFAAGEEKRLSVYAPQGNFLLPVTTIDNLDYVDLYEIFQPLATTVLKLQGKRAYLNVNGVTLELTDGASRALVGGHRYELSSKALINNGRPMVATADLTSLLARSLAVAVNFHETARRLFLGNTGAQFSATLKSAGEGNGASSTLVLSFPAPVSPRMIAEGNHLRMIFMREPVLAGADNVRYNDPLFTGLSYSESNGSAEIVVSGTAPLLAGFSGNGQIISVSAAPAPPASAAAHAAQPANNSSEPVAGAPANATGQAQEPSPGGATPATTMRVQVVIDPAHGGSDSGERFTDNLLEKDLNLAFARRLRNALQERGILSLLLRDGDRDLTPEARSAAANSQRPQFYIALHTSGLGAGLRVSSELISLPQAGASRRFIPASMAQSFYAQRSRNMASAMASSLSKNSFNSETAVAPVSPLSRVACPAVAVEIAPPPDDRDVSTLSSSDYQQSVAEGLAKAIAGLLPGAEQK